MNNLQITDYDYSLESGFVWLIVSDNDSEYSIQACLREDGRSEEVRYIKQIDRDDNGMDDGLCGDSNECVFDKYGKENVCGFFMTKVRSLMNVRTA